MGGSRNKAVGGDSNSDKKAADSSVL
jgi:CTD small phosphatase-like protein 2